MSTALDDLEQFEAEAVAGMNTPATHSTTQGSALADLDALESTAIAGMRDQAAQRLQQVGGQPGTVSTFAREWLSGLLGREPSIDLRSMAGGAPDPSPSLSRLIERGAVSDGGQARDRSPALDQLDALEAAATSPAPAPLSPAEQAVRDGIERTLADARVRTQRGATPLPAQVASQQTAALSPAEEVVLKAMVRAVPRNGWRGKVEFNPNANQPTPELSAEGTAAAERARLAAVA